MKRANRTVRPIVPFWAYLGLLVVVVPAVGALGIGEAATFSSTPAEVSLTYDFEADTVSTEEVTVTGGIRDYGVGISAGGSGSADARELSGPGGTVLSYQIFDTVASGVIVKDLDAAPDGSGLLTGRTFFNDSPQNFDVIVYQGQLVPPGVYSDLVTLSVYDSSDGTPTISDQEPLPISVTVAPFVSIAVVDTGGLFDPASDNILLDFGSLALGVQRSLDLLVVANIDYVVTVDSTNQGALALLPPGDGSTVPYTFEVDGIFQNLSSGTAQVLNGSGPTPLAGNRHTFAFEIGDPTGATSGVYEDNLTITVTAQ
jgi:spore coat protein U-like protein